VPVPTAPAPVAAAAPAPAPVAEAPAPVAAEPAPAPAAPSAAVPLAPAGGSMDELARHLRDNPEDTAGRLALAIGYEQRDDLTRAMEQYRLLIKGRNVPENLLDIVTGNLRDLVEGQPDNPALHRLLGDAYMKQGQYQMAISQYNWLLTKGTR
jgi:tetratricopeptide (TPR) repeat protein